MAAMWMSVFVLLSISANLVERVTSATAYECYILTGKDTSSYQLSDYACCQNAYFAVMQVQCCTKGTQCLCNPNYNYGSMKCILGAAPPTVAVVSLSSSTTTKLTATAAPSTAAPTMIPTSTVTTTTSTTTTVIPTTTPAPVPLCPSTTTARLLDSTAVLSASCVGSGTVGFEITDSGEALCNGALVENLASGAYDVYTVTSCINKIISLLSNGISVSFLVGDQRLPMDACAIKDATISDPLSSIVLHPLADFVMETLTASCADTGCVYNRTTMKDAIDWGKCYVTSYGATELTSTVGGQLTSILVKQTDISPCLPAPAGIQCFEAVTTGTACQDLGDDGAPVHCSLNTGEYALYGFAYVTSCQNGNTFFSVYPMKPNTVVATTPGGIIIAPP